MADTLRDLANGTIGEPYRSPGMRAVGTLADLLAAAGQRMDHVGVTMPEWSPIAPGKSLTLKDMLIGDLARVLEDTSYGMGPVRGGNYATGGIGTYGLKPDAMELANAVPLAALAGKGIARGAKALAPTAAEMVQQKADSLMALTGGKMHAVQPGGRAMPNFIPDDVLPARNLIEVHDVTDRGKLDHIVKDMTENGWRGDPLLVFDDGDGVYAFNGSHRIAAARKTGTDVPVIYVDDERFVSALDDAGETFDNIIGSGDDRVADFFRKAGDNRAADLMDIEFDSALKNRPRKK